MGRARGGHQTVTVARRGIDPRRLLSVADPLIAGRDIRAAGEGAATRMDVRPPHTSPELLAAAERIGSFCPREYQGNWYSRSVNFVVSGEIMRKNTGAAYRGHLGFRTDKEGELHFCAFCTYGSSEEHHAPVYEGDDLGEAVKVLNRRLQSKLRGDKYTPPSGNPDAVKLSEQKFLDAFTARDPHFAGVPA